MGVRRLAESGRVTSQWYDPAVAFVRWDPLQDLLATQQRMDRLATGPTGWTPAVDVFETPDRYVVMVELPGLTQDDVQLQHHEGRLTISGMRRERESPCEQFHRIERGHGELQPDVSICRCRSTPNASRRICGTAC